MVLVIVEHALLATFDQPVHGLGLRLVDGVAVAVDWRLVSRVREALRLVALFASQASRELVQWTKRRPLLLERLISFLLLLRFGRIEAFEFPLLRAHVARQVEVQAPYLKHLVLLFVHLTSLLVGTVGLLGRQLCTLLRLILRGSFSVHDSWRLHFDLLFWRIFRQLLHLIEPVFLKRRRLFESRILLCVNLPLVYSIRCAELAIRELPLLHVLLCLVVLQVLQHLCDHDVLQRLRQSGMVPDLIQLALGVRHRQLLVQLVIKH